MIKKLPLGSLFKDSWLYCRQHWREMSLFSAVFYLLFSAVVYLWSKPIFIPLLMVIYVFWGCFFRYYFNRKPYIQLQALFSSLIPSTKIVVVSVVVTLFLLFLPFAPVLMKLSGKYIEIYNMFLVKYMQDDDVIGAVVNLLLVVLSPLLVFRPFMAWISALIGRSVSLKSALLRSRGNYWEFLLLGVLISLSFSIICQLPAEFGVPYPISLLAYAPLVTYFNVLQAKIYDFFYLDLDAESE